MTNDNEFGSDYLIEAPRLRLPKPIMDITTTLTLLNEAKSRYRQATGRDNFLDIQVSPVFFDTVEKYADEHLQMIRQNTELPEGTMIIAGDRVIRNEKLQGMAMWVTPKGRR